MDLNTLLSTGGLLLFYVLLFVFTLHAFFLAYHWFTFGTDHKTSMLALSVNLMGGAILFLTFAFSLSLM